MASPFSSSSDIDDSAIDALIAEATDLCALEQIAALNTAHLSDSHLPTNLESRFQKLKSFPASTNPNPNPSPKPSPPQSTHEDKENMPGIESEAPVLSQDPKPEQSKKIREQTPTERESSPSPPRQMCFCFGCSPRRVQRRGSDDDDDEILSEFGSSGKLKEQRRRLKKAWREQEKASREAEKMAKWVKQVSARINEAAIDELLKEEFK